MAQKTIVARRTGKAASALALNARVTRQVTELVTNELMNRQRLIEGWLDPRRNIEEECGHPEIIKISDYKWMSRRGDIAKRIINLLPSESWRRKPEVFETEDEEDTEFEKAWKSLQKKRKIFTNLQRIDFLSGIGRFGVLLLGFNDKKTLDQPVVGVGEDGEPNGAGNSELSYLRTFDESFVRISEIEDDVSNPRYGMPTEYSIGFDSITNGVIGGEDAVSTKEQKVHWSRIVHVADNLENSLIYGMPRLEWVANRMLDLKKVAGGSAEMFWKGGFPGLSIESAVAPDGSLCEFDTDAVREQVEAYMNTLQRYIGLQGMTAKSLAPQIADPNSSVRTQLLLISIAIGCPMRVLLGTEEGRLAGDQDSVTWNQRLKQRQDDYLTPDLIHPLVSRLQMAGALPPVADEELGVQIEWPDLNTPSDEQKATVAEKRTNALAKYVAGGCDAMTSPFHFYTLFLGFTAKEAESMIDQAENRQDEIDLTPEPDPALVKAAAKAQTDRMAAVTGPVKRKPVKK